MKASDFVLFYVKDPAASVSFYEMLLGLEPVEQSPGFAMFVMPGGFKLGLWRASAVEPRTDATVGGAEIMFDCNTDAEVDVVHAEWAAKGAEILQSPTLKEFGYTFTAADPDGHRLRVYRRADDPV